MWDQVRVDHGKEFVLMNYIQHLLRDHRYNTSRDPVKQTASKDVILFITYSCLKIGSNV